MCKHATYTSYAPGPDGMLGTADDMVTGYQIIDFEPGPQDFGYKAHPVKVLYEDASGTPNIFEKWTYDPQGHRSAVTQYATGPDGQYDTGDDTVEAINEYTNDAMGLLINDIFHTGAGPDGVWGDADDELTASIVFLHDQGRIAWALPGTYAGPDGIWGDADDVFQASERLEYDDKGHLIAFDLSNVAGPDGKFGTNDDVIVSRTVFPWRGDRVVMESYDSPGPDGKWGTPDDVVSGDVIESGDVCSSASCEAPVTPW